MYTGIAVEEIRFDWDEANRSHLARHRVKPEEAEQAILKDPVNLGFAHAGDEPRWAVVGRTDRGRFLVVAFTERGSAVRVVTAFDASKRDEAVYFAQKGKL